MQHGRGTGRKLFAPVQGGTPVQENLQPLDRSSLGTYRDSIRRVSISGDLWGTAQGFFPVPASSDSEADDDGAYCWSSASSASSPSLDTWARRRSPFSSSSFSDWEEAAADPGGVQELRAIAQQMVHDGYLQGQIRAFGGAGRSRSSASPHRLEDSLLGSWFLELDVLWVLSIGEGVQLHLEDGCASLLDMMKRWIKALKTMVQVLCITRQELRAKRAAVGGVRNAIWHAVLLATGKVAEREQEAVHFVPFAEASVLRMLDFVDAVADAVVRNDDDDHAPPGTLPGLLQVYTCVADDSPAVLALFQDASVTSNMFDAMNSVFLRKMNRLSDAIWSVMEKVRTSFVTGDCLSVSSSAEGGGVYQTTRLMMNYITLLSRNERALSLILQDNQYLSLPDHCSSKVDVVIKDMISCLEKQLEKTSNFISDSGLRYIFLMNNCSFISQNVSSLVLPSWTLFEDYKIERPKKRDSRGRPPPMDDYVNQPDPNLQGQIEMDSNLDGLIKTQSFIEAYLDASWEPVLSWLYHDIQTPRGLLNLGGRLDKFENEFRETYAMQKQWKVPNPELRKRLRKAVIQRVIPAYSKYLAERTAKGKSNRPPKNTPLAMEELLEELFEG